MKRLTTWLKILWAWLAAAAMLAVYLLVERRKGVAEGEARGRAGADRERLREAENSGSDEAVLKEFRRQTKGGK